MLWFGSITCFLSALGSLLLVELAAASDLFKDELGDISYCKKQCQLKIKNKNAAKVSVSLYDNIFAYIKWEILLFKHKLTCIIVIIIFITH